MKPQRDAPKELWRQASIVERGKRRRLSFRARALIEPCTPIFHSPSGTVRIVVRGDVDGLEGSPLVDELTPEAYRRDHHEGEAFLA